MSEETPDTPRRPDLRYNRSSIARASILSSSCRYRTTPGSSAPVRVPITSPSSAVNPIVVATLLPASNAHIDAPLPRCATITRPRAATGSIAGSAPAMNSYDKMADRGDAVPRKIALDEIQQKRRCGDVIERLRRPCVLPDDDAGSIARNEPRAFG